MNDDARKRTLFNDSVAALVASNNEIAGVMPDITNEHPNLSFKTFSALLTAVFKYSSAAKNILKADRRAADLNPQIAWPELLDIGGQLWDKDASSNIFFVYQNISEAFVPLMTSLKSLKWPEGLSLPPAAEQIQPLTVDLRLLRSPPPQAGPK